MTYFGFTMVVNGIPIDYRGIQLIEHRILYYINPNQPYNDIKHQLLYGIYNDFAFTKSFNLKYVIDKCIEYTILPIINLCVTEGSWKNYPRLTPSEVAKIGAVLNDILQEYKFTVDTAFIGLFNEPNTQQNLSSEEVCQYTNALDDAVDFRVVYGNDEYGNLNWTYLAQNCRSKVMGIHHLSSVGFWDDPRKYFKNIAECKAIANTYGKQIIGTECGSWFRDYCNEGHQINLEIMAECKKYSYLGCLIVLPDINQYSKSVWKLLGYRIWNKEFTQKITGCESKFIDCMNYIKINGTPVKMKGKDGMILASVKFGTKGYLTELVEELLILHGYDIDVNGYFDNVDVIALKGFQTSIKDKYPNIVVDGICGRKGYFYLINELTDSLKREEYHHKLEIWGSPVE